MQTLKATLRNELKNAGKVAILGIGSELRGDDAAGVLVARKCERCFEKVGHVKVFHGSTAPENFTGEIKKFKPTHIIMIDSADIKKSAGEVAVIDLNNIGGVSFSTHRLPTKIMAEYLIG
ncbi:MAG: hydrogenase maturation protease, partial [Candidatus Omnitrophica bacterium]|nr:hydrogenase maturation protease [Candidatus Omnitrophota bacterium]